MDDILKSDIFFFITAVAVMILTAIWVVVLYYLIKVIREASRFTRIIREEAELLREDLDEMREEIKQEGRKAKPIMSFLINTASRFTNFHTTKKKGHR